MPIRCVLLSAAAAFLLADAAPAVASCIPQTRAEQLGRADIVFEGVALEGPTESGRQRFRVEEFAKGGGPRVVRVATGVSEAPDGSATITSVSIRAEAGERWRIYGRQTGGALETSICDGSVRLATARAGGEVPPEAADTVAGRSDRMLLQAVVVAGAAVALLALAVVAGRRRRVRAG
jgi:hypothetical protein